ncbi:MAG: BMP family ABC transporter substrate-binding protein [Clostridia bacterium]|nr:BMP family ABC transporter substrate-binding protein [Clostridia bacterium]
MKKIIALLLVCAMTLACLMLSSCKLLDGENIEIAMITDGGNVDDSSLNQAVWESVANFAIAKNKSCDAYHPATQTHEDRVDCIMKAVVNGAKVVVCSGRALEEAVFEVEDLFPDVRFILVDGEPRGVVQTSGLWAPVDTTDESVVTTAGKETPQVKISSNVYCITFREEQAGYLAGFVAVRSGYTKLGFVSAEDSVSDMLYGCGFLQGIQDAAREMGILDRITVKFRYSGANTTDEILLNVAENWYIAGTEVIFASGTTCSSVIEAAELTNGRVICTDSDHSPASNLVVTSAMKFVYTPITNALNSLYDNEMKWDENHAGRSVRLGVVEDGVGLPTESSSWRLGGFTVEAYEAVVARIVGGEIKVSDGDEILREHEMIVEFTS